MILPPKVTSRRQDVVLDAGDVDVAVRAVALHGEELEVAAEERGVDLGEGQRVALGRVRRRALPGYLRGEGGEELSEDREELLQ